MSFLNSWRAVKYTNKPKEEDIKLPDSASNLPTTVQACVIQFISSLVSPVHPQLLSPEELAKAFQNFYKHTDEFIASTLIPQPSSKDQNVPLLFPEEIDAQKKARQHLLNQKDEWMDQIEDIVCEYLYDRIFCLSTSTDAAKDDLLKKFIASEEKKELINCIPIPDDEKLTNRLHEVSEAFFALDEQHTPRSKINTFMTVNSSILNASQLPQEELNADSLLNLTIYCILCYPGFHLISHLNFVLRFRNADFLSGEQRYCLTTFEAALTFILRACPNLLTQSSIQPSDDPLSLEVANSETVSTSNSLHDPSAEPYPVNRSSLSNLRNLGLALEKSYASLLSKVANHTAKSSEDSSNSVEFVGDPPLERFLTVSDASDLKIGEIELLLSDYKRLARLLFEKNGNQ